MTTPRAHHVCATQAVCFECFKSGIERARARREAWAQRVLPFEEAPARLTAQAIAHRKQMLEHLSRLAKRA